MEDSRKISIIDTTLRDGEQSPGIAFTTDEKIKIARYLDRLGVDFIEVGTPAIGSEEQQAIDRIIAMNLRPTIITWNRAVLSDIQRSIECGSRFLHISLPVSDIHIRHKLQKGREWVINTLEKIGNYINREGLRFSVGAEDASRADLDFLIAYATLAKEIGAERLRYCDTVGILNPFQVYKNVSELLDAVAIPIEIHVHNDLGMAVANVLAGAKAGATCLDTTILGIGERAGNAALEEVVMALQCTMGICLAIDKTLFCELARFMSHAIGREIPLGKPVVGHHVFTHESGVHVDGVLKMPETYEPFSPQEVGNTRRLVIGKHSGRHAIIERFKELGISIDNGESITILQKVRKSAISIKGNLPDSELMRIYEEMRKWGGSKKIDVAY